MSSRVDIILISRVDTITVIGLLVHNDYSVTCEKLGDRFPESNQCLLHTVRYILEKSLGLE